MAGLSLALGLVKEGYRVEVVEKQFDFYRVGATFGLQPNGILALNELDPSSTSSSSSSESKDEKKEKDDDKAMPSLTEELIDLGVRIPMTGGRMLGWWNVRDALLRRVQQQQHHKIGNGSSNMTLHLGWMIQEVEDGDASVTATFKKRKENANDTSNDQEMMTLEGCVLVGADGVNSAVRGFLQLTPAKATDIMLWRGRLKINDETAPPATSTTEERVSQEAQDLLRPMLTTSFVPIGIRMRGPMNYVLFNFHEKLPGTMALVVNVKGENVCDIQPGTTPREFMEIAAEDEAELKEMQAILELLEKDGLHHPVRLKVVELPKNDGQGWGGSGRTTITGDAAHGMRPASGQGGSMAFEDSVILCRVLKKLKERSTTRTKSAVEEALQEYENIRLPRVRQLWDDQWERSEKVYSNVAMTPWSKEFSDFIFNGV